MQNYYMRKLFSGALAAVLALTLVQPTYAVELDTEIPSAGASVVIDNYNGTADISEYLPTGTIIESPVEIDSEEDLANNSEEAKYFKNIAICKVEGGKEGYVNVRKSPSTDGEIVGKIFNNCGARIIEAKNGWYKISSGNVEGYIKSEYFVTGDHAKQYALDTGYVFAYVKEDAVRVRNHSNTDGELVTTVYKGDIYSVKSFNDDGSWTKIKIGEGVNGFVASKYVSVTVDMETAITLEEEKAIIEKQKEEERRRQAALEEARRKKAAEEEAKRKAAAEAEAERRAEQAANNDDDDDYVEPANDDNYEEPQNNYEEEENGYGDEDAGSDVPESGNGSAVVAFAQQFLGNPYVWGGSSLTGGTDCSGFTMSVYAHFGVSLNRTSYTQVYDGVAVSMDALAPGDLLFYNYGGGTISHVAIYIGGGQIIHASSPETGIIISGMGSPCAARRVI